MRTLALSEEILLNIKKPARYIGGEYNSIQKRKEEVEVRICFAFPDVYEAILKRLN
jgi:tetrahydromethanopterin S-methyltransferase subunit G